MCLLPWAALRSDSEQLQRGEGRDNMEKDEEEQPIRTW
jgi:hypothetical protein